MQLIDLRQSALGRCPGYRKESHFGTSWCKSSFWGAAFGSCMYLNEYLVAELETPPAVFHQPWQRLGAEHDVCSGYSASHSSAGCPGLQNRLEDGRPPLNTLTCLIQTTGIVFVFFRSGGWPHL